MQIETDERFRERKVGTWKSGWLEKRWADFTCAEEGGECLASVQSRNMEALKEVLADYAGKTVVIGTHGTALATIFTICSSGRSSNAENTSLLTSMLSRNGCIGRGSPTLIRRRCGFESRRPVFSDDFFMSNAIGHKQRMPYLAGFLQIRCLW